MFGWFRRDPSEKAARTVYRCLIDLFPYKRDAGEQYFTVLQCLNRKGGDCDDYANGWHAQLKAWDFSPKVAHGWLEGVYHAVCVCDFLGVEWVLCNVYGPVKAKDYFSTRMPDHKILTDEELELKWSIWRQDGDR